MGDASDAELALRVQNRVLTELADERDVASLRAAIEQLASELVPDARLALLPIDSLGRLTIPEPTPTGALRVAGEPEVTLVMGALRGDEPVRLPRVDVPTLAALGLVEHPDPSGAWCVPLRVGERRSGVLLLGASDAVDAMARGLLRALAPAVAIALENVQLFAREHVRAARLTAANELAQVVARCTTRTEVHEAVLTEVSTRFAYARTVIYDSDLGMLAEDGASNGRGVDRERSLVSTAMHRRCASRVERPDRTCHALPLISGDHIHAVLYVEQETALTPEQDGDDIVVLSAICEHTAACLVALEATERIERSYKDTIQSLVHALEARDPYTADHSDVVAEWSLETGRRLGMCEDDLRDLELGAILHDIGKVAIPDDILNKPGRLTAEEFEVMKSHTIMGEHILRPLGFLKNVAPIVRHEHERWDGCGYPDGISGTDIPLASRIIFVCDAYHAITSDRPYREGQPHAFARRILVENAGTQFDPAVVSVFLGVIDQWCLEHGVVVDEMDDVGVEIVNPMRDAGAADDAAAA